MTRPAGRGTASVCAAMAVPVAAASLFIATPAMAATVSGTATLAVPGASSGALRSGSATTPFTVELPANASCPADTAHHGYLVYSYLVPRGTDLAAVKFVNFPSEGYGLVDTTGTYYGAVNTAEHTGQIIGIPNDFEWGPLTKRAGSVSLSKLVGGPNHGVWEAGMACANTHGFFARGWNTQVTFTSHGSGTGGFTWAAVPGAPPGAFSSGGATVHRPAEAAPTASTSSSVAAAAVTGSRPAPSGSGLSGTSGGTTHGGTRTGAPAVSPAVDGAPVLAVIAGAVVVALIGAILFLIWRIRSAAAR
jgi:hypothetical protein